MQVTLCAGSWPVEEHGVQQTNTQTDAEVFLVVICNMISSGTSRTK